jgi:hypothetical protein
MSSMIASIKENRALGHRKKTPKDAAIGGRAKLINDPLTFNKMSPEVRADHRKKLIRNRKRVKIQSLVVYGTIALITIAFLAWVSQL